jgi:hypothetical protein
VTVDLYAPPEASPAQAALADVLDREWQAQSRRMAPLAVTRNVRESIELVLADSPFGIFAVASELDHPAASPAELLERLHDRLPVTVSSWTARTLRRVGSLRPPQPQLAPPAAPAALEAPPPEAPARSALEVPATLALAPEPEPLEQAEQPAHEPRRRLVPALALAGAAGVVVGAALGALASTLALAHTPAGALAGALAAAVGGGVGWVARGGGRAER